MTNLLYTPGFSCIRGPLQQTTATVPSSHDISSGSARLTADAVMPDDALPPSTSSNTGLVTVSTPHSVTAPTKYQHLLIVPFDLTIWTRPVRCCTCLHTLQQFAEHSEKTFIKVFALVCVYNERHLKPDGVALEECLCDLYTHFTPQVPAALATWWTGSPSSTHACCLNDSPEMDPRCSYGPGLHDSQFGNTAKVP